MTDSRTSRYRSVAPIRHGRTAASPIATASPNATSQSRIIVIGKMNRRATAIPAHAEGQAARSSRSRPQLSRRKAASVRITATATAGVATPLSQNRGCPGPKPPGDNHHQAIASKP